ncbi:MAG TPA: histidine kinase [Chitinophagaceae bacterium]|nr:histidine kinase [Chitinophagaceae bacterium]
MATSPLSVMRFRIIFSICWLIIVADHIFLLKWFGLSWKNAIVDSTVNDVLLISACLLVIMMLRYYLPQKEKYFHVVTWCVLITIIVILLTKVILKNIFAADSEYIAFFSRSLWIRTSFDFLLLGCFTLVSVIWYNWQEQSEQETIKQDAEKLTKEAELFKLRQQLQPHFLFNSLNSINALIGTRPEEARKMVQQLSDFLRGTIRKEEHQWVTLKEELQYLQLYLDIEKVRFGHRLSTNINCDRGLEDLKLPALLLQPIMENAIKFGLYDTIDEIEIRLSATKEDNNLVITVTNPFDPETAVPKQGTGFGLQSVQRRLYLLFARNDLINTVAKENIFTTIIKIPQA